MDQEAEGGDKVEMEKTTQAPEEGMDGFKPEEHSDNTAEIIRLYWKELLYAVAPNVTIIAAHLYAKYQITAEEEELIIPCVGDSKDRGARVLNYVERKGRNCLYELINVMKSPLLHPHRELAVKLESAMKKSDPATVVFTSRNSHRKEITQWQKWLIINNYNYLRERVDPQTFIDDMIACGVVQPAEREVTNRLNRYERVGWLVWQLFHKASEETFDTFMHILEKAESSVYHTMKEQEKDARNDPRACLCSDTDKLFTVLKIRHVKTLDGEIIYDVFHQIKDEVLQLLTRKLERYCSVNGLREGCLAVHLKFDSLIKLTEFWLAYLNGSLSDELVDVFVAEEMSMEHANTKLMLDIEFSLDQYVILAYSLSTKKLCPGENHTCQKTALKGHSAAKTDFLLMDTPQSLGKKGTLSEETVLRKETSSLNPSSISKKECKDDLLFASRVQKTRSRLRTHYYNRDVACLAMNGGFIFVVHEESDLLYVYREKNLMESDGHQHLVSANEDGDGSEDSLITIVCVPGMRRPWGLCVPVASTENLKLCISDLDSRKLHWISVSFLGSHCMVDSIEQQDLSYKPGGLSFDENSQTLIVTDPQSHCLHLYDSHGHATAEVMITADITPYQVAPGGSECYIICDSYNRKVAWVKGDGTITRILKNSDIDYRFLDPCHIDTDQQGRLFLADYSAHNVLLFSHDGRYICHLLSHYDHITRPSRVAVNQKEGKIIISHCWWRCPELLCLH